MHRTLSSLRLVRQWRSSIVLAGLLLCAAGNAISAQSTDADDSRSWLLGGSIGIPSLDGELYSEATMIGFHATRVTPGRPGLDFAVSIAPRAFTAGAVAGAALAGISMPLELTPNALLLPVAGVTLAGAVGSGGVASIGGVHAGVSVASVRAGKVGLRAGLTGHRLSGGGATVFLLEIGIVRRR